MTSARNAMAACAVLALAGLAWTTTSARDLAPWSSGRQGR